MAHSNDRATGSLAPRAALAALVLALLGVVAASCFRASHGAMPVGRVPSGAIPARARPAEQVRAANPDASPDAASGSARRAPVVLAAYPGPMP